MDYNLSFPSLDALLLEAAKPSPLKHSERASIKVWDNDAFCPVTLAQAIDLARNGWSDGAKQMARAMRDCVVKSETFAYEADVTGEFFDMGDIISGVPECWRVEVSETGHRFLDIYVGTTISSFITNVFRRGAAICNLIDMLERDGVRVRVVAVNACSLAFSSFQALIEIKRHSDAMDIDKMAFVFAHLGFSRRVIFAMNEAQPMQCIVDCGLRLSDGNGRPNDKRPRGIDTKALFIPSNLEFETDNEAQAWITKTVADVMK